VAFVIGPDRAFRCLNTVSLAACRADPSIHPCALATAVGGGAAAGRCSWRSPSSSGAFLLLQLVPYGHDHGAPATTRRARLGPAGERVASVACMDCHSNRTTWPWYSNIAPVSLLVVNDVKGGRERMNLSRWDHPQPELREVVRVIDEGEMPPGK